MTIRFGQIYRPCNPDSDAARIKVIDHELDAGRARVDVVPLLANGRRGRPRTIPRTELHATAMTPLGVTRRIGYVLETDRT